MNWHHERVQKLVAEVIARSSAGIGLCLVGGYRLRLLHSSVRRSADLDYHCDGDLEQKRAVLLRQLRDLLVPLIRQRFGWKSELWPATGPDADSPFVKTLEVVAFPPADRVVVPVDLLRIPLLDPPMTRTIDGTVYLTATDADAIEGKVLAVVLRTFVEARDLVDLFLHQSSLTARSPARTAEKLERLAVATADIGDKLAAIARLRRHLGSQIDLVLEQQVEPATAAILRSQGGGPFIFDQALELLRRCLPRGPEARP